MFHSLWNITSVGISIIVGFVVSSISSKIYHHFWSLTDRVKFSTAQYLVKKYIAIISIFFVTIYLSLCLVNGDLLETYGFGNEYLNDIKMIKKAAVSKIFNSKKNQKTSIDSNERENGFNKSNQTDASKERPSTSISQMSKTAKTAPVTKEKGPPSVASQASSEPYTNSVVPQKRTLDVNTKKDASIKRERFYVILKEYNVGDKKWLTATDIFDKEIIGLCADQKICNDFDKETFNKKFAGKGATVTVATGKSEDGSGNDKEEAVSFEEIKIQTSVTENIPKTEITAGIPSQAIDQDQIKIFKNDKLNLLIESAYSGDTGKLESIIDKIRLQVKPIKGNRVEARKFNDLGLAAIKNKDLQGAENYFLQGSKADPSDPELINNYAYILLRNSKYNESIAALENSLILSVERSSAWFNLYDSQVNVDSNIKSTCGSLLMGLRFSKNKENSFKYLEDQIVNEERPKENIKRREAVDCAKIKFPN